MFAEEHVIKWWGRCSDEQRAQLKKAAESTRIVDSDTLELLVATRPPYGPVGTRWDSDPEFSWSWPSEMRDFILSQ